MDPAGKRDGLADVRRAQFVAVMRAFHEIFRRGERKSWPETARFSKVFSGTHGQDAATLGFRLRTLDIKLKIYVEQPQTISVSPD
jgi:hypothetical protein